jgi:hypothetical protein
MSGQKFTFFASSDVVAIGTNPEMADISNPSGAVYGYAACVIAENEKGSRWAKHVKTAYWENEAMVVANALADQLTARMEKLNKLPVDFADWQPTTPRYGSDMHDESSLMDEEEKTELARPGRRPRMP